MYYICKSTPLSINLSPSSNYYQILLLLPTNYSVQYKNNLCNKLNKHITVIYLKKVIFKQKHKSNKRQILGLYSRPNL